MDENLDVVQAFLGFCLAVSLLFLSLESSKNGRGRLMVYES